MFRGEPAFALIVAAGQSTRMDRDKVFASLCGAPLLARTVEVFLYSPWVDEVVVVLRRERLRTGRRLAARRGWPRQVRFCPGGGRRQDSVRLGLEALSEAEGWVLIHDGARPLVSWALVVRGLEAAAHTGAAVPGLPLADTVKLVSESGCVEQTLPRDRLRAVQTPQVFRLSLIRAAHRQLSQSDRTFTDDAALLEALGHPVAVFPGDAGNFKVTDPQDLQRARRAWRAEEGHRG